MPPLSGQVLAGVHCGDSGDSGDSADGISGITTGDGDAAGEGATSCARALAAHSEVTVASNTTHAGKHLSVIVPPPQ